MKGVGSTVSSEDSDHSSASRGRGRGGRKGKRYSKKKSTPRPVKSLSRRLDLIHEAALSKIVEANESLSPPAGCVDDHLAQEPIDKELSEKHHELPLTLTGKY